MKQQIINRFPGIGCAWVDANGKTLSEYYMCVDTTVRAAMDHGYHVKLVADACATMDLELKGEIIPAETVQKAFIASLNGVFATVI